MIRRHNRNRLYENSANLEQFLSDNGYRKVYNGVYKIDNGSKGDLALVIRKLKELDYKTVDYVEYTSATDVDYDLYKFEHIDKTVYVGYRYSDDEIVVAFKPTGIFIDAGMADSFNESYRINKRKPMVRKLSESHNNNFYKDIYDLIKGRYESALQFLRNQYMYDVYDETAMMTSKDEVSNADLINQYSGYSFVPDDFGGYDWKDLK